MAQLPKGGLVRGYDKPIHGSYAIYFPGGIYVFSTQLLPFFCVYFWGLLLWMLHLRRFPQSRIRHCHHCRRHLCNSVIHEGWKVEPVEPVEPWYKTVGGWLVFQEIDFLRLFWIMTLVVLFEFRDSDVSWCLANKVLVYTYQEPKPVYIYRYEQIRFVCPLFNTKRCRFLDWSTRDLQMMSPGGILPSSRQLMSLKIEESTSPMFIHILYIIIS